MSGGWVGGGRERWSGLGRGLEGMRIENGSGDLAWRRTRESRFGWCSVWHLERMDRYNRRRCS